MLKAFVLPFVTAVKMKLNGQLEIFTVNGQATLSLSVKLVEARQNLSDKTYLINGMIMIKFSVKINQSRYVDYVIQMLLELHPLYIIHDKVSKNHMIKTCDRK